MSKIESNNYLNIYQENIKTLRLNKDNNGEFAHLSDQVYLDFAANSIYMASLVQEYTNKLIKNEPISLFSNPHSHSQSGIYTNLYVDTTRQKVLNMLNSNQNEYDVVFVMNATQGLKLLAESFNFDLDEQTEIGESSNFAYLNDNHTSVIGMREIVWKNSPDTNIYCVNEKEDLSLSARFISTPYENNTNLTKPTKKNSLFVFPAQSNFNGRKYDLNLIEKIKQNNLDSSIPKGNWFVCLDTASYACTSRLDLAKHKPDFLVLSFYKIFGFPSGIGALLIKKNEKIRKSLGKKAYFGGGTVSMALIDQNKVCLKNCLPKQNGVYKIKNYNFHEIFEDGTVPYLEILGLSLAIDKFDKITFYQGFGLIQSYLEKLSEYCLECLESLKHYNNSSLVEIYRKKSVEHGPIFAFNLKNSQGSYIGFNLVDKLAQGQGIHLRTGCFCNIGACQIFLEHLNESKNFLENFELHGHKCGDHIDLINGKPTGALRISFGYATIKSDIDYFLRFLKENFIETKKEIKSDLNENYLEVNSKLRQYFKITHLFVYPIKSCAPIQVDSSWPINKNSGLMYDRSFIIVDSNNIPLSQKRFPMLTKLTTSIDLNSKKLRLNFEDSSFEINLDTGFQNKSIVYTNNSAGYDQGDEVSVWVSQVLGLKENCRLFKISETEEKNSFVNKADYLLINANSIRKLREFLLKESEIDAIKLKAIDEYLILQFRPNIVVSSSLDTEISSQFDEEKWTSLKILNKNLEFKIVENCTRCQMININQNFVKHDNIQDIQTIGASLLKQLYKLKSNSKFGIYLSQSGNSQSNKVDLSFLGLTIGDIGISENF